MYITQFYYSLINHISQSFENESLKCNRFSGMTWCDQLLQRRISLYRILILKFK
jgi:hypothetical protein